MPNLRQISEAANALVGTRFGDNQVVSALLNQYVWSDGNLHDVVEVGWRADRVPGVHYVRVEALPDWDARVIANVNYQRCVIEQIYAGATDNSACTDLGLQVEIRPPTLNPTPQGAPTPAVPPPGPTLTPTPTVPPPTIGSMVLGSSGIPVGETYAQQITREYVRAAYFYGQATPTYQQLTNMGVPASHAAAFQTKGITRSGYDSTLHTFPATRAAPVLLHYQNEIDRHVHIGDLTLTEAQQRIDALFASIAAADKPYVIPTLGVQYWALEQYNGGSKAPEWDFPAYLRPGLKHILFSSYADPRVVSGHTVYTDPKPRAAAIDKLLGEHPGISWSLVFGYPIPDAQIGDATSLQNRAAYLQAAFDAYRSMAHPPQRMLWFDYYQPGQGDERLAEPVLHAKWQALCASLGQTSAPTPTPAPPPPTPTPGPPPPTGGTVLFEDDFTGSTLDTSKWNVITNTLVSGVSFLASNVFLNGQGQLVVRTARRAGGGYSGGFVGTFIWGSGHPPRSVKVSLPVPFHIEAHVRMPPVHGAHAGVWLSNVDRTTSQNIYELDMAEERMTLPTDAGSHIHTWLNGSDHAPADASLPVSNMGTNYHVYTADVKAGEVVNYVDGVPTVGPHTPFYGVSGHFGILINNEIDPPGTWGAAGGQPAASDPGPWDMLIDYVRVTAL